MALLAELLSLLTANPAFVAVVALLAVFILALSLMLKAPPAGPNPFKKDVTRPVAPLVTDQSERDKVLKNGFHIKKIPQNLDAICIGSGAGALTVANILAKTGKKVLVLEQHDQAGGCCHTYIEKGFEFDVGIHYIGEMRNNTTSRALIAQMTEGQLTWVDLEENYDIVGLGEPGKERRYKWIAGEKQWRDQMIEYFPKEEAAIDKFLGLLKEVRGSMLGMFLLKLKPKWMCRLLIATGLLGQITKFFSFTKRSLQQVLDELSDDDEFKAVIAYSFGDYGTTPSESSFHMHAVLLNHYIRGGSYPFGGASEIAFHMIPPIKKAGGDVLVRARVSEILFNEQGHAAGVRVPKQSGDVDIFAPTIISDAGVLNTFLSLMPKEMAVKSDVFKYIGKNVKSGIGALSLFVGLKGTAEELGVKAQNFWVFPNNRIDEATHEFTSKPSVEDAVKGDIPLLFISFPSSKDPSFSDRFPGKCTLAVITLSPWEWFSEWKDARHGKRGEDYEAMKKMLTDKLIDQVSKYFPQIEGKIEYVELGTPVTNNYYLAAPKGEIYGLDHNKARFTPQATMDLRPETGIPGLYLTGQDILSCGFIGAIMGGLLTSCTLLNRNVYDDISQLRVQMKNKKKAE